MPSKDLMDLKFPKKLKKETSMIENEESKTKEEKPEENQTEEKTSRWVLLFDVSQFRFFFLPALVLSIAIPLIAGFVFSILRINDDPILFQFSAIIMVILLCTFSLLRRSKLAVLFNFPIAAIVYLIVFIAHLLTNGWFLYPFGIFGSISRGPLSMILNNLINLGWIDETINLSTIILIPPILDLVFVAFISVIIGFFATVLITGFKNSEGSINLFIIPLKLLSAIFLILLVITIPLTYVGLSKFAEGSAFFGASVTEFAFLQRHPGDSGGLGTQYYSPFDLLNPEFKQLFLEAVARAYDDLMKSYTSFRHVQENFLLNFLLDYVVPQQIQMDNYTAINTQNIARLLDLTLILADIMQAAPGLVHGFVNSYYGLRTGASIIVNAFESQNSLYNESFSYVADQISTGVNNFTIVARAPLISAIDGSLNILDDVFVALKEEKDSSVRTYLEVYRFGIPAVIHVFQTCPYLINATYKVMLGINNILDLELSTAFEWMVSAVLDVLIAIEILLDFDDSHLVSIEEEPFPFRATLGFVRDLRDTLVFLVKAGESYVNYYITIDNILILLDQIDLNATGSSNDPRWNYINQNVSKAETYLNDLASNVSAAYNKTGFFKEKYYGPLTDTIRPIWDDMHTLSSGFRNNTEEMAQLSSVLTLTINATHHFSYGSENLISSLEIAIDNDTFAGLQTTHNAESNLTMAASEANQAYTSLSILKYINIDAKKNWLDILKDGGSNQSLHGLITQMITVIDKVKVEDYPLAEGLLMVVLMRSKMEELVNFWSVLGFK